MKDIIRHILKEETNNVKLVKDIVHDMFDNVKFVEYVPERNEIMVFYTNHDNRQMLIPTEICDKISQYTGLDVVPWYEHREPDNQPDFYIDTEEYEEPTNEKNLRAIKTILPQVSWDGLCDIWVEYNPVDKDYEIRSKSTQRHFDHDEIIKELDFLDNGIRSMGLNVYIYTPLYVEDCEDEVKFMNESINKSDEKRNKIIEKIMDDIIFPEYNHIICGYDVKNDEVFNEPVVNVTFIGGYGTKLWPVTQGIQKMYSDILDEIWNTIYDYINIPVGVTMNTTTKCL